MRLLKEPPKCFARQLSESKLAALDLVRLCSAFGNVRSLAFRLGGHRRSTSASSSEIKQRRHRLVVRWVTARVRIHLGEMDLDYFRYTISFSLTYLIELKSICQSCHDFQKGSPSRVLAKKICFCISLSWPQNRVLTPKRSPQVVTRSSTSQKSIFPYLA